jgi:hypothetical protein
MRISHVIVSRASIVLAASAVLSTKGSAQRVMLELRPRVGDTISMRLEQQTEIAGRREGAKAPPTTMVNSSTTFSRAVVESAVTSFTTILAITDSVLLSSTGQGRAAAAATQRQLQSRQVRLTIAPDGQVGMANDGSAPVKGMWRAASLIPATFPTKPVAVGDKWTREAPLPAGTTQLGTGMAGRVKATFRLDSLTRNGDLAWVSMHGDLAADPNSKGADGIATIEAGTVDGWMVIDHARGWLTESQFTIVAHSTLRPSFGTASQPINFEMRLTQRLHTIRP